MSSTWLWVHLKQVKSLIKEMVGGMGVRLVSFHMKVVFPGEPFVVSKNWVALGRADNPVNWATKARAPKLQEGRKELRPFGLVNGCQT